MSVTNNTRSFRTRVGTFIHSTAGKVVLAVVSLGITGYALYASWGKLATFPSFVAHASILGVLASAALFLVAGLIKNGVWWLQFRKPRPNLFSLASARSVTSILSLGVPGVVTEVFCLALVKKSDRRSEDLEAVGVAQATSDLMDPIAMAPFAIFTALTVSLSSLVHWALYAYAGVGVVMMLFILALPTLVVHHKLGNSKFVNKLAGYWTGPKDAIIGWLASTVTFVLRSLSMLVLLNAMGVRGGSLWLMMAAQIIGNVVGIIPVGAVGGVVGTVTVLTAAGVASSAALQFSVASPLVGATAGIVFLPVLVAFLVKAKRERKRASRR